MDMTTVKGKTARAVVTGRFDPILKEYTLQVCNFIMRGKS